MYQEFEEAFNGLPTADLQKLTATFGPPVDLDDEAYANYLNKLRTSIDGEGTDLRFYLVLNITTLELEFLCGLNRALGYPDDTSYKGILQLIHPEYLRPYLMWGMSAYKTGFTMKQLLQPLKISYRVSLPLLHSNGKYYWYSQHTTPIRVDKDHNLICHLNSYAYEGEWSIYNQRPFEACLSRNNTQFEVLENKMHEILATDFILDNFRNSEVELLQLYIDGAQNAKAIMERREGWSKHVVYEYNKNVLKKAKALFNYDFREARDVALYFREKGYL
jgi:hypothetical protein